MKRLLLLISLAACGARETYIPQPPDPADFGVTNAIAETGDTGTAPEGS